MTQPMIGVIGLAYPPLMPPAADDQPTKREEFHSLVTALGRMPPVLGPFWAESRDDVASFVASEGGNDVDVVVIVPMTAAPPDWGIAACPAGTVAVIWDPSPGSRVRDDADQTSAHADTSSIGALMLAGGLRAGGRPYVAFSGRGPSAVAEVANAVHVATVATQMRTLRVLQIEDPIADYSTLDLRSADTSGIGLQVEYARVSDLAIARSDDEPTHAHGLSVGLANSIAQLAESTRCDAIAMNCHSSNFKGSTEVGVVGCLAASGDTPTACTADVPTAWLLLLMRRLSGTGLYCEPYTIDDSRSASLLANCGIGMRQMAVPGTWRIAPSQYYPGANGRGDSVAMTVLPGEATFVTSRGWQSGDIEIVVCEGRILDDRLPAFGGAHGFFQPSSGNGRTMVNDLARLGTLHHGVLSLGSRLEDIQLIGALLGIKVRAL